GSRRDSVQDSGDNGRQAGGGRGRRDARRLLPRGFGGRLARPRGAHYGARGAVRVGDTGRRGRENHHGRRGRGLRRPAPGGV
ncbi:MAG: Acyl carrier protein, partial [uncultured Rubrobacteraceae bacterium]